MAAEILKGGAEVVKFRAVEDKEAIMEDSGRPDGQRRVLLVELGDGRRGQGGCGRFLRRGDGDGNPTALAGEEVERGVVAVVVDEDNAFRGLPDELAGERPGIVVLALEEHFLRREIAAIHRLENPVETLLVAGLVGDLLRPVFQLAPFGFGDSGHDGGDGGEGLAHRDESVGDADGCFDRHGRIQRRSEHDDAVLGKGIGAVSRPSAL